MSSLALSILGAACPLADTSGAFFIRHDGDDAVVCITHSSGHTEVTVHPSESAPEVLLELQGHDFNLAFEAAFSTAHGAPGQRVTLMDARGPAVHWLDNGALVSKTVSRTPDMVSSPIYGATEHDGCVYYSVQTGLLGKEVMMECPNAEPRQVFIGHVVGRFRTGVVGINDEGSFVANRARGLRPLGIEGPITAVASRISGDYAFSNQPDGSTSAFRVSEGTESIVVQELGTMEGTIEAIPIQRRRRVDRPCHRQEALRVEPPRTGGVAGGAEVPSREDPARAGRIDQRRVRILRAGLSDPQAPNRTWIAGSGVCYCGLRGDLSPMVGGATR